jgi:Do/DeqQ family serine protease
MRHRFAAALVVVALAAGTAGSALAQDRTVPASQTQLRLSFAPVVKRVAPAVVNVYANHLVKERSPFADDPFFRRFFGDDGPGVPRERVSSSLGSGTIIDPSGIIVTNHHVIKDATDVKVALADKREFEADIVLKDEKTDLAVLRIRDKGSYPYAAIGDSDALEVGDVVLAIGNPFGVGQTVTQGIVSGLARTQVGVTDYRFFIQTDAAINPGNSGGALVDLDGRLIGVPSSIYSRSGGSIGIGFAIPANMVKFVVEQAKNGTMVRRPWFGATLQVVTADVAEGLGLARPVGALVTGLVAGGPAAKAGLQVGDLVSTIDGAAVEDPDGFGYRFSTKPLGGHTELGVTRAGKALNLTVALAAAPETVPRDVRAIPGRANSPFAGIKAANLSPAVAEELRLPMTSEGVVVAEVADGTPAQRIGFQLGDIVLDVNGTRIDSTRTLERISQSNPGVWRLSVKRGQQVLRMALRG